MRRLCVARGAAIPKNPCVDTADVPPCAASFAKQQASALASGIMLVESIRSHTVILQRPLDLPAALEERFARAAARLADVEAELPPAATKTAARVVVVSDFVLGILLRHPQRLCARLADDAPLDPESLMARLGLATADEAQAMAALRRTREVEMARIAWRDLAGVADLEATLADVSLLAECLIGDRGQSYICPCNCHWRM